MNATDPFAKVSLADAVIPAGQCIAGFGPMIWIIIVIANVFWTVYLIVIIWETIGNWQIRSFFQNALGIQDVS